jgi:valyl-tRNA synthetase
MSELPKKYNHVDEEASLAKLWNALRVFEWDKTRPREETFVVDTPPPTVSGSLHIGHVFSYTHTDILVRYQRMLGKNICYPMGWDDNGLPTERRVQNVFGITCNSTLPFQKDWQPEKKSAKDDSVEEVSRKNFVNACQRLTTEDEKVFEHLWRRLGLSVDWSLQYATIDPHCQKTSQASFLDLVSKGLVYQTEAPTMWDTDFKTAVAQAEVEDREKGGAYHDIEFQVEGGGSFIISTTRPELLPACIAVVAHPDDERYKPLFGKNAISPLFNAPVPIRAADHADPEKGSGILMVCTFGDIHDVEWWKQSGLPLKQVLGRDGRLLPVSFGDGVFESVDADAANKNYSQLEGLFANQARKKMAELLAEAGVLKGDIKQIMHPVKFYEKGDRPLEFIPTRQWFVNILEHKNDLLAQGDKIQWHPEFMKTRYSNWVEGLNQDWCISRQRYFGVPFPVWYPMDAHGEPQYDKAIYATVDALPIDPMSDVPPGYSEEQRDAPNGFTGDPDVMDTWATSSMTPQIVSGWVNDKKKHDSVFPMDIRPQSHEIIRTWAFYTIVKAWFHEQKIPWKHVTISGWVLDPDRKKMSKSKGNVVTPEHLLDHYSSDGVRYWAAKARLGSDTAFDDGVFQVGYRLVTKVFNASKFVLMQLDGVGHSTPKMITEPVDLSYVAGLNSVVEKCTAALEKLDYASALDAAESAFWDFCDYYIELVKGRAYREEDEAKKRSAQATLDISLSVFLRLLAPYTPYITERVWQARYNDLSKSVHVATWPQPINVSDELNSSSDLYSTAKEIISIIRSEKTNAQKSMKAEVATLGLSGDTAFIDCAKLAESDIKRAGVVSDVNYTENSSAVTISVSLAEPAS